VSSNQRRLDRVSAAIHEEIARFLTSGVKDPRVTGLVTVTGAHVTPDLRHARVYVSVLGDESKREETLEGLQSLVRSSEARGRAKSPVATRARNNIRL
jgi:ribosome-binding factor A